MRNSREHQKTHQEIIHDLTAQVRVSIHRWIHGIIHSPRVQKGIWWLRAFSASSFFWASAASFSASSFFWASAAFLASASARASSHGSFFMAALARARACKAQIACLGSSEFAIHNCMLHIKLLHQNPCPSCCSLPAPFFRPFLGPARHRLHINGMLGLADLICVIFTGHNYRSMHATTAVRHHDSQGESGFLCRHAKNMKVITREKNNARASNKASITSMYVYILSPIAPDLYFSRMRAVFTLAIPSSAASNVSAGVSAFT